MKNALRTFSQLNRRGCRAFDRIFPKFFVGSKNYSADLEEIISHQISSTNAKTILEVGGIDRPILKKNDAFLYIGLDIEEKSSCYQVYDEFFVQSIENPIPIRANLVISTTLFEHVKNNAAGVHQIYQCLEVNGATAHYIPSKYHPYSIILRSIGNRMQKLLIDVLRPDAASVTGYPAFFDHCSPRQMRKIFLDAGFRDVHIVPYYRATDYFAFLLPAYVLVAAYENIIEMLGIAEGHLDFSPFSAVQGQYACLTRAGRGLLRCLAA